MKELQKQLPSRVVQIQVMSYAPSANNGQCHALFALCEDGTIWQQWHSLESANVPRDGLWYPVLANDKAETSERSGDDSVKTLVRPWIGQLHHACEPCYDWGCIRDEAGTVIIRVSLPTYAESVLNEHRRNKTDPTQERVDAILAALNKPNEQ